MHDRFQIIRAVFLLVYANAYGQTGPTLVGTGYGLPATIRVAPGQITTLFVTGLKTVLSSQQVKATTLPLPSTLSGISVTLSESNFGPQSMPVPLLSIQQNSACEDAATPPAPSGPGPDCLITAITVQIPFELVPPDDSVPDMFATPTEVVVSENGNPSKAFRIVPVIDNIHVLNMCDTFLLGPVDPRNFCNAVVTHGDGTLVTAANPAKTGEEIVVYAIGLGRTTPLVKSGEPTPPHAHAAVLDRSVFVQFDFRPNATPTRPYPDTATAGIFGFAIPEFVGLTPNQVGLYQVNIQLPSHFPPVQPCDVGPGAAGGLSTLALSNLTIDIGGLNSLGLGTVTSFDGAAICVESPTS